MRSTKRSCRSTFAFTSALLITACQGGAGSPVTAVPPQSSTLRGAPAFTASLDGRGKCGIGTIHIYKGPSGNGGAVQIASDRKGDLWYGSIGMNAIVKYKLGQHPTTYSIPSASAKPEGIALDPHGDVWFTEWNLPTIGRLAKGKFTQSKIVALKGSASQAVDMILGPDNRMWFTTDENGIGAHTVGGKTKLYAIKNNAEQPTKLTIGADKNLWFTEFNGPNIGKITTSGSVTEYNVGAGGNNFGIAAGSDGRIWFTDSANHRIGAINTDGSGVQYYSVGSGSPAEIASRSQDGNLYFTEWEGYVGQITTKGVVRVCAIKASPTFAAFGITENKHDHTMWFVDNSGNSRIGQLSVR